MTDLHKPVLLQETLELLMPVPFTEGWFLDGTFGRGGHSKEILNKYPDSRILALDCDAQAVAYAKDNYQGEIAAGRLEIHHKNFVDFASVIGDKKIIGALLDLGVSSPQLDQPERGFSFYKDGPLDMRMDQSSDRTAADIINGWDDKALIDLFQDWGEIRRPHRVVNAIIEDRRKESFARTQPLADMIARIDGWRKKGHHPATNYFMAIRIAVNEELDVVERVIPPLVGQLSAGGRLLIISFHSLEDRIIKYAFKQLATDGEGLLVNKKVIQASRLEEKTNPRSRSAKLRAFERGIARRA